MIFMLLVNDVQTVYNYYYCVTMINFVEFEESYLFVFIYVQLYILRRNWILFDQPEHNVELLPVSILPVENKFFDMTSSRR